MHLTWLGHPICIQTITRFTHFHLFSQTVITPLNLHFLSSIHVQRFLTTSNQVPHVKGTGNICDNSYWRIFRYKLVTADQYNVNHRVELVQCNCQTRSQNFLRSQFNQGTQIPHVGSINLHTEGCVPSQSVFLCLALMMVEIYKGVITTVFITA